MMRSVWLLAMLLLATPRAIAAEPLGRLFYTPAERVRLEERRHSPGPPEAAAPTALRYSGYVTRQHGPTTLWVDGQALRSDDPELRARHIAPLSDGRVRFAAPGSPSLRLRVGESVIGHEVVAAYRIERPAADADAPPDAGLPASPPRLLRRRGVDPRDTGDAP